MREAGAYDRTGRSAEDQVCAREINALLHESREHSRFPGLSYWAASAQNQRMVLCLAATLRSSGAVGKK